VLEAQLPAVDGGEALSQDATVPSLLPAVESGEKAVLRVPLL
jgi:hypothetical protein